MKRAPIIEDWSRFNRAVLEIADARPQPMPQKEAAPQQPKREPAERASEPGDAGDSYGVIARQNWSKRA
jgi:hypothetical protein